MQRFRCWRSHSWRGLPMRAHLLSLAQPYGCRAAAPSRVAKLDRDTIETGVPALSSRGPGPPTTPPCLPEAHACARAPACEHMSV